MEVVGMVVGVMPGVGEGFEWSAGGTDPSASIATVMLGNPFYRKTKNARSLQHLASEIIPRR